MTGPGVFDWTRPVRLGDTNLLVGDVAACVEALLAAPRPVRIGCAWRGHPVVVVPARKPRTRSSRRS